MKRRRRRRERGYCGPPDSDVRAKRMHSLGREKPQRARRAVSSAACLKRQVRERVISGRCPCFCLDWMRNGLVCLHRPPRTFCGINQVTLQLHLCIITVEPRVGPASSCSTRSPFSGPMRPRLRVLLARRRRPIDQQSPPTPPERTVTTAPSLSQQDGVCSSDNAVRSLAQCFGSCVHSLFPPCSP